MLHVLLMHFRPAQTSLLRIILLILGVAASHPRQVLENLKQLELETDGPTLNNFKGLAFRGISVLRFQTNTLPASRSIFHTALMISIAAVKL